MAKTFHDTDGDIRAVMKTMLDSKEFFSQGAYRAKVKTPFEMIVSAVRATGAEVDYALPLAQPDRAAGRAAVSQAGADRLFERERGVDQFGGAAGAHEFRARAGAEQGAGREGGHGAVRRRSRRDAARQVLFTDADARRRAMRSRKRWREKQKNPSAADAGAGGGPGARLARFSETVGSDVCMTSDAFF